ncbi:RNA 2'-phosphotransferase [Chitinophaga pendula]|uniref:RNA 2'-phosphotransferase n=1 Tax=Chitinophaga TaxID=79328 RepID=UPI000BB0B61E|nr:MULTISPECIES: RNA 2'-phosphotransferase [Chitinophaga]ASZ13450.1 hypothetical protein CK934_22060 [Chitinophaga sp. MD30]UCJ08924.1 RNA 2'-phosphotransferase [Chitinophaga pendula]
MIALLSLGGVSLRQANQGHSVKIDLALQAQQPPAQLYHGTVSRFLDSIRETGLLKMTRQHVHLSTELLTAQKVGGRRGRPYILSVDSAKMFHDGHVFFLSDNGVWLTDHVPPRYIDFNYQPEDGK